MTDASTDPKLAERGVPAQTNAAAESNAARRFGLVMTLPAQLLFLFIVIFPLGMLIYLSVSDWTPYTGRQWVHAWQYWNDFGNFREIPYDDRLWGSIGKTAIIIAVAVPIELIFGFGLAYLFLDRLPLRPIVYATLLIPMMVVPSVAGYMFFLLLQGEGPINQFISAIAGTDIRINWLGDPTMALVSVIIADIWQWSSFMFLILYAGMLSVPEDQMRAAALLGASKAQRFFRIILPRMKVVVAIALIIRTVELFGHKNFDIPYIMTAGGPGIATETISIYMYKKTFLDLERAYVSAVGLFIVVALSIPILIGLRQARKAGK